MNGYYEERKFDPAFPMFTSVKFMPLNFRAHWQESIEIVYCLEGHQTVQIGDTVLNVVNGSALVIPPGYLHGFMGGSISLKAGLVIFASSFPDLVSFTGKDTEHSEHDKFLNFISSCWLISGFVNTDIFKILENLHIEINSKYPFNRMSARALMNLLLAETARAWLLAENRSSRIFIPKSHMRSNTGIEKVKEAISFIENNYTERITLEMAASHINFDKHHFCRIFKRITGNTYFEYLNSYRINMASKDLLSYDIPITEVALKNGFGNINSFERVFKLHTGHTPSSFKNLYIKK